MNTGLAYPADGGRAGGLEDRRAGGLEDRGTRRAVRMEMGVTRPAGMEVGVKRPAPTALESVTKKVQLRSRGRVIGVVRESYLRSGTCICTAPASAQHLHLLRTCICSAPAPAPHLHLLRTCTCTFTPGRT